MPLDWAGKWDQPGLDNEFRNDVQGVLGPDEDAWRIIFAVRTHEEQQALYEKHLAGGPLAAPPGRSAHEYGLAVDICRLVGTGITQKERWDYDHPAWARIRAAVDAHPRLHGGWHFPVEDPDHLQAVKWKTLRQTLVQP
jgi:hypothetical protein